MKMTDATERLTALGQHPGWQSFGCGWSPVRMAWARGGDTVCWDLSSTYNLLLILSGVVMNNPVRILFLCTGNSARSQIAEGFLRSMGKAQYAVFSAGTAPKTLHPMAVEVMREVNIDISAQHSKDLNQFVGQQFDYIITVCDRARDNCPTFPGDVVHIHWSFEDPATATGSESERLDLFRRVRNEIRNRILIWHPTVLKKLRDAGVTL
jgi:arsenate reductase (thioredoxin)